MSVTTTLVFFKSRIVDYENYIRGTSNVNDFYEDKDFRDTNFLNSVEEETPPHNRKPIGRKVVSDINRNFNVHS